MTQDVFLITAEAELKKVSRLGDEAYIAYHGLISQKTKYAEGVWNLYLLWAHIEDTIRTDIEQHKKLMEEMGNAPNK